MIELVILDLDNTLYLESQYINGVMKLFEDQLGLKDSLLQKSFAKVNRIQSKDILGDTLKLSGLYTDNNHNILFDIYSNASIALLPFVDTLQTLKEIQCLGCTTAILTNGVIKVQKNKIRCLKAEFWVDDIFYARDNPKNYEKPHISAFSRVLDSYQVASSNAIMIGDSYDNDYLGAKNAGLNAVWFNSHEKNSKHIINNLSQALNIIKELKR